MVSNQSLYFAGLFLSFVLQVSAAYVTCSLVNRTVVRPRQRFRMWTAFLAGSAIYWLALMAWSASAIAEHRTFAQSATTHSFASPAFFLVPASLSTVIFTAEKILLFAYAVILAALLGVSIWRRFHLESLLRQGWTAPEDMVDLFEHTRRELGVKRCELLIMPGLSSPATVGWLRPRVLLPAACEDLGATSRLADVFRHELAHVARRDYFWAGVSDLICRVLFFLPMVWRARKLARFQGELACDLSVIEAQPERRIDYADSLAYFVRLRMMEERAAMGIDFASSDSGLGTRIRLILMESRVVPWWKRAPQRAAALALLFAFALATPALTVSLGFVQALPENIASPQPQAPVSQAQHRARTAISRSQTQLPPVTDLNTLRTANRLPDTPAYLLTRADAVRSDTFSGSDRTWQEREPSMRRPSMAEVLTSAVAIAITRNDHDRDHETKHLGK
jgi:beta-lactamase regulating signal transducer with metallopeptidase domain